MLSAVINGHSLVTTKIYGRSTRMKFVFVLIFYLWLRKTELKVIICYDRTPGSRTVSTFNKSLEKIDGIEF